MKMFEGCTIGNRLPYIEASARLIFNKIGINTSQAPFSCCPDPTGIKSFNNDAWLLLGAQNLCLAEKEGKDIISLCNGCANTLQGVKLTLMHDSYLKKKINSELAKIGKEYKGLINVKHFVDVLKDNLESVKKAITKPLNGLKVACHPGCHYMRPSEWMNSDDPLKPKNLQEIVSATGANVIDYEELSLCCGSAINKAYPEHGLAILNRKLSSIKKANTDVIVVNCPACFQQFDTLQKDLTKKFNIEFNIPVLYLTEILALSMGFKPEEIGLEFHRTRLNSVLSLLGF